MQLLIWTEPLLFLLLHCYIEQSSGESNGIFGMKCSLQLQETLEVGTMPTFSIKKTQEKKKRNGTVPVSRPGLYGLPGQPNPYLASRQRTEEARGWRAPLLQDGVEGDCPAPALKKLQDWRCGCGGPFGSRPPKPDEANRRTRDGVARMGHWPHGWRQRKGSLVGPSCFSLRYHHKPLKD